WGVTGNGPTPALGHACARRASGSIFVSRDGGKIVVMFDFFKRNQAPSTKQIERVVKRLTEPQGEDAPRIEAAEKLFEWGTPDALYGLLKRFTISSKTMSTDIEQKQQVVRMLVEKGEEAVEPILRFVSAHHQV